MLTTYDAGTGTFGHATMVVQPSIVPLIIRAQQKLNEEMAKDGRGEPFDALFVFGHDPGEWILAGQRYKKLGERLWQRES